MAALNISVVIPTYNRAQLVGRAVESVLHQTKPPDEIIVVDDGSEDDTQAQLARFGAQIRCIRQPNQGVAVARDTGVKAAASAWIAFLDSDDIWERQYLQQMTQVVVETAERADLYFADAHVPASYGARTFWECRNFAIEGEYAFCEDGTAWVMMPGQPMSIIVSLIKREAYFACGGFWAEMHNREDTHLFLKLGLGRPLCAVNCLGATVSEDDVPENRLTLRLNQKRKLGHLYHVMMFDELLARDISSEVRCGLEYRLARSHYRLAMLNLREMAWMKAGKHLWRSFRADSEVSRQEIWRKLATMTKLIPMPPPLPNQKRNGRV